MLEKVVEVGGCSASPAVDASSGPGRAGDGPIFWDRVAGPCPDLCPELWTDRPSGCRSRVDFRIVDRGGLG